MFYAHNLICANLVLGLNYSCTMEKLNITKHTILINNVLVRYHLKTPILSYLSLFYSSFIPITRKTVLFYLFI